MLYPLSYVPSTFPSITRLAENGKDDRKFDRQFPNHAGRYGFNSRTYQAVLTAETANFDDYGHNNTTMGKIIDSNLSKD